MTNNASAEATEKADMPSDADVETLDDIDVGTALMAALGTRDMGEPSVELNLSLLTPTERRTVLKLLRHQLEIGEAVWRATGRKPEAIIVPEKAQA